MTVANINIRDPKRGEAFDNAFDALERRAKAAEWGKALRMENEMSISW